MCFRGRECVCVLKRYDFNLLIILNAIKKIVGATEMKSKRQQQHQQPSTNAPSVLFYVSLLTVASVQCSPNIFLSFSIHHCFMFYLTSKLFEEHKNSRTAEDQIFTIRKRMQRIFLFFWNSSHRTGQQTTWLPSTISMESDRINNIFPFRMTVHLFLLSKHIFFLFCSQPKPTCNPTKHTFEIRRRCNNKKKYKFFNCLKNFDSSSATTKFAFKHCVRL